MITDKILTCCDCTKSFIFGVAEQEFFQTKNLVNLPKRCPNCRVVMRLKRNGASVTTLSEVACAQCTAPTVVPFQPSGNRPVLCANCFALKKRNARQLPQPNAMFDNQYDDTVYGDVSRN